MLDSILICAVCLNDIREIFKEDEIFLGEKCYYFRFCGKDCLNTFNKVEKYRNNPEQYCNKIY